MTILFTKMTRYNNTLIFVLAVVPWIHIVFGFQSPLTTSFLQQYYHHQHNYQKFQQCFISKTLQKFDQCQLPSIKSRCDILRERVFLLAGTNDNDESSTSTGSQKTIRIRDMVKGWLKQSITVVLGKRQRMIATMGIALMTTTFSTIGTKPLPADASAPVMALPKAEGRDPASEAIMEYERRQISINQKELNDMASEARKIEMEYGEKARIQFENDYKERKQKEANERTVALVELKRSLLEQGICPFTDLEGQRQTILLSRGVDLGKVPGTQFYLEKQFELKNPKRSYAYKKAMNRKVIECMVQDMKNRNIDPVEYFERHQEQTEAILDLPVERAVALVKAYETNLESYGQILPPRDGEMSVKEKQKVAATEAALAAAADPKFKKVEALRIKNEEKKKMQEAKEREKLAKARIASEAQAAKVAAKELEKKAKADANAAALKATNDIKQAEKKFSDKVTATATAAATAGTIAATAASTAATGIADTVQDSISSIVEQIEVHGSTSTDNVNNNAGAVETTETETTTSTTTLPDSITATGLKSKTSTSIAGKDVSTSVTRGGAFVVVAVGGVAFKMYRDKSIQDEQERQRQLRLLMGGGKSSSSSSTLTTPASSAPALEEIDVDLDYDKDDDDDDDVFATGKQASPRIVPNIPPEPLSVTDSTPPALPKKRRLGLKNVFGKKKNERETDLMILVSEDADARDFTMTLSKLLTFGAPGRFPNVIKLPGGMPMTKFELEEAKQILIDAQTQDELSLEESAEIFANVVNCMLIDIVDLASASLKEKDEKITVDAINVVVDFMNHAASLYDSIAEGVTIKPVTYGGDLGQSKLEQMYSTYAVSGMLNVDSMTDDFDNRVAMLQDVFQINEKKAEGLMMKAMQKNMMKMIKTGEGMEGMEEMVKNMGGMDGMMPPGLGGMDGDGPSPEQLKEMLTTLKGLKDSGSIPVEEFDKVKKQFNDAFGSSIDDVVKEASANNEELSRTDKELLELMKSIMNE